MFNTQQQKNWWTFIASVVWLPVWKLLIHLGEDFLRNLGYSAFVDRLSSFGVPEEKLIKAFDLVFPYLILLLGFYLIYFCIKKARLEDVKKLGAEINEISNTLQNFDSLVEKERSRLMLEKLVGNQNPKKESKQVSGIISRSEWKENQKANLFASEVLASRKINMELDQIEETRLGKWFSFLDLKICQGNELCNDHLLEGQIVLNWFDEVLSGFKTALQEGKYPYINRCGPYYGEIQRNLKIDDNVRRNQESIKNVFLPAIRDYKNQKPPITDLDFRPEFKSEMLERYKGKPCP